MYDNAERRVVVLVTARFDHNVEVCPERMKTRPPPNSIFDGPITNLLSFLSFPSFFPFFFFFFFFFFFLVMYSSFCAAYSTIVIVLIIK